MDARAFFKEIKEAPKNAYYLHGDEEYLKDRALEALVALIDDPSGMGVSDLADPTAQALIEACETLPFFSQRRIVIVRSIKALEKDAKLLGEYLSRLPETTLLVIFERAAADKRKALYKLFDKLGCVVEFAPVSDEDAARFLVKTAQRRGCTLEAREARLFVAMAGNSLLELNNELNKCCDFVTDGRITADVITALVHRSIETNIFHMLDAFLSGRTGDGMEQLYDMLLTGEEPLRILAFLSGRFRLMLTGKRALEAGMPRDKALAAIGGSKFAAGKALDAAKRFTLGELYAALELFSNADADIKLSKQSPRLALETALLSVTYQGPKAPPQSRPFPTDMPWL